MKRNFIMLKGPFHSAFLAHVVSWFASCLHFQSNGMEPNQDDELMQAEPNPHDSEATKTLSSPSQKCWISSQESEVSVPQVDPPLWYHTKFIVKDLGRR